MRCKSSIVKWRVFSKQCRMTIYIKLQFMQKLYLLITNFIFYVAFRHMGYDNWYWKTLRTNGWLIDRHDDIWIKYCKHKKHAIPNILFANTDGILKHCQTLKNIFIESLCRIKYIFRRELLNISNHHSWSIKHPKLTHQLKISFYFVESRV